MQKPPGQAWPQQLQHQQGYGQPPTSYGQSSSSYPPQQGQWAQQPYTPYPPQQGFAPQQPYPPQQGQWQQPITPNPQWSQQPYLRTPPQQPKKKGKLKWVLISLAVLLVFCIGGCALFSS